MDIPSTSMINSDNGVLQQFGIAMLDTQLDVQASQAATEVAMINAMPSPSLESMVNPSVGGNIDIRV
ncbi:MAG: YjfB family protein [Lachnospiraceae bacterium]|nr:YjfB family protein [Lachnospiraceae bacterium]